MLMKVAFFFFIVFALKKGVDRGAWRSQGPIGDLQTAPRALCVPPSHRLAPRKAHILPLTTLSRLPFGPSVQTLTPSYRET
jgi:hypothetical protein